MDRYLLELDSGTKNRLERLKQHPEEAHSEVINRLIDAYEDEASLTKEEVEEIRQALHDLKEGKFVTRGLAREEPVQAMGDWFVHGPQVRAEPARAPETPLSSMGDPQAVKDMEALFSGTARSLPIPDRELTPSESPGTDTDYTDSVDIHEIDPYDKRGRARTPHLDSL